MNEEEKLENAKWAGLCLCGLLVTLVFLLWGVWSEWGVLMLGLALCSFSYMSYLSLVMNAYPALYSTLSKCN